MSLKIEKLSKAFGEQRLFEGLSLTLDRPTVLWARSGWGKTTLLRILLGLERPDGGSVSGVGRAGAVFQEDRLIAHLNALENVRLVLRRPVTDEALTAAFARLNLSGEALRLPVGRLSGGQKRRVALLRALEAEADTLILDEPFTGMDPETLALAAALINEKAGGRNVLLATHDSAAIAALGWPVLELETL